MMLLKEKGVAAIVMKNWTSLRIRSKSSDSAYDAYRRNMNLFVQSPRSIVCFANLIYANRINSRGMSRVFCDLRSQKTPRGILPMNSNKIYQFP